LHLVGFSPPDFINLSCLWSI